MNDIIPLDVKLIFCNRVKEFGAFDNNRMDLGSSCRTGFSMCISGMGYDFVYGMTLR